MKREEVLLTILAEECMEVAQRCTKALRFGIREVQPGQELTNAQRITQEMADLQATFNVLMQEGSLRAPTIFDVMRKYEKLEKYLAYSKECGTLES